MGDRRTRWIEPDRSEVGASFWYFLGRMDEVDALCDIAAGIGRGIVAAQIALDERTESSLERWETEGIPPSGWTLRDCRIRVALAPRILASRDTGRARLNVARHRPGGARLVVAFRRVGERAQEDP